VADAGAEIGAGTALPLDGSTILTSIRPPETESTAQSPALQRAHYLVVLEGAACGRSVPLGDAPVTIGRTAPAGLVLVNGADGTEPRPAITHSVPDPIRSLSRASAAPDSLYREHL
jgi:hypothetical protein